MEQAGDLIRLLTRYLNTPSPLNGSVEEQLMELVRTMIRRYGTVSHNEALIAFERDPHGSTVLFEQTLQELLSGLFPRSSNGVVTVTGGTIDGVVAGIIQNLSVISPETRYDVKGLSAENPYVSLRSFTYADKARYFGRKNEVLEATQKLVESKEQILFVTGASGSGKSSFVEAGVRPALEATLANLRWARFRPEADYREGLTKAWHTLTGSTLPKQCSPEEWCTTMQDHASQEQAMVLVIDQFEELFFQPPERQHTFLTLLKNLPSVLESNFYIIVTLRSDYIGKLFDDKLYPLLDKGIKLHHMDDDHIRAVIEGPLIIYNADLKNTKEKYCEPALVDTLIKQAMGEEAYLPLLQVTLYQLWSAGSLTLKEYTRDGSGHHLSEALQKQAKHSIARVSADRSIIDVDGNIRTILLKLLTISTARDGGTTITRAQEKKSFVAPTVDDEKIVQELATARLLVTTEDRVELTHDIVLTKWDRLVNLIEDKDFKQDLQQRERFGQALSEWIQLNKNDRRLLTGARFGEAKALEANGYLDTADRDIYEFLQKSKQLRRKIQYQLFGIVAVMVVLVAITVVVTTSRNAIARLKAQAESTADLQALLFQSQNDIPAFDRFILRYEAATRLLASAPDGTAIEPQQSSQRLLYQQAFKVLTQWFDHTSLPSTVLLHPSRVLSVAWRPDGGSILTGSWDGVRLWNVSTGISTTLAYTATVWDVGWSPNGDQIVTAAADGSVRVWDVESGIERFRIESPPTADGMKIAWSPDGKSIAIASPDKTVSIWNATDGTQRITLVGHTKRVWSVAWSPDNHSVITTSDDQTARIWDVATGKELQRLHGFDAIARDVAWSPNGAWIATASIVSTGESSEFIAQIWDAHTGTHMKDLRGHSGALQRVSWNATSTGLVTAADDTTARVWNVATGVVSTTLIGHTQGLMDAMWSADGQRIVTVSFDGTASIWPSTPSLLAATFHGHTDNVWGVAWSPDGTAAATASRDKTVRIWDVDTGTSQTVFTGTAGIWKVAWSPDGTMLAAASDDHLGHVWTIDPTDRRTLTNHIALTGHISGVKNLAWSPDGQYLATVSNDQTARIWRITPQQIPSHTAVMTLTGHTAPVWGVAWSSDGMLLATASEDHTVRIWNPLEGTQAHDPIMFGDKVWDVAWSPLLHDRRLAIAGSFQVTIWNEANESMVGMQGPITIAQSVAWSPDGSRILAGALDKTAKIWDAQDGTSLALITGHTNHVWDAVWNPNGTKILVGSSDQTADIWCIPMQLKDLVNTINQRVPINLNMHYAGRAQYSDLVLNESAFLIDQKGASRPLTSGSCTRP